MTARTGPPGTGPAAVVSGGREDERLGGGYVTSTIRAGSVTTVLDWRDAAHWNGGQQVPCHLCGGLTFLLDDLGWPCHKACAERPASETEAGRG
jgi:hypothetical protein